MGQPGDCFVIPTSELESVSSMIPTLQILSMRNRIGFSRPSREPVGSLRRWGHHSWATNGAHHTGGWCLGGHTTVVQEVQAVAYRHLNPPVKSADPALLLTPPSGPGH